MSTFRKVALKPSKGRDKLGRINTKVSKLSKTPGIVRVHDLELSSPTASLISKISPEIEEVSKYNFPEAVKTAIIANIVDQAAESMNESFSSFGSPIRPKRGDSSSPKFSTPAVKSPGVKDSLLRELSHLYNSQGEILDMQGDPIPGSNIERVTSWMQKRKDTDTRGPVGTRRLAYELAHERPDLTIYARNPKFFDQFEFIKEVQNEQRRADEKRRKREAKNLKKSKMHKWELANGRVLGFDIDLLVSTEYISVYKKTSFNYISIPEISYFYLVNG